jgi:curved DNA-binding protein CbpA
VSYYDLLEVAADAPADEIKRAFRREIAKYHPDKVQHLGKEFQDIAAAKAAELTTAYKTLLDPAARAEYDATIGRAPAAAAAEAAPPASAPASQARPPSGTWFASERRGAVEFVRRAAIARFQAALTREFGEHERLAPHGFEAAASPAPGFFSRKIPPQVVGRVVESVDARGVAETWGLSFKMKKEPQRDVCVFLMGPSLAPPSELAAAISEQRKRPIPGGGRLVLVPVNTKDWHAHVPTDAPDVVKSLLSRLQAK